MYASLQSRLTLKEVLTVNDKDLFAECMAALGDLYPFDNTSQAISSSCDCLRHVFEGVKVSMRCHTFCDVYSVYDAARSEQYTRACLLP